MFNKSNCVIIKHSTSLKIVIIIIKQNKKCTHKTIRASAG